MSCHGFGLFEPHQVEDRRRYVGQDTVADRFHAVGNHDDRHRIERMGRIGRAVGIDRIVGVAVIGDENIKGILYLSNDGTTSYIA